MTDLRTWLESVQLADLYDVLVANGIDANVLADLTEADLRETGLNVGQRARLRKAIATLRPEPAPQRKSPAAAERRQLTVMFIDLVGSTDLAARRDAEEVRDVIWSFSRCCAEVVERNGGTVAQYLGDGVLVYFGYPHAEEDTAERAVRAGLSVIAEVAKLDLLPGQRFRTRIGAATGLVVTGDLFGGEVGAQGETPNLAARLQGVARPDTMVIAGSTRDLVGTLFDCQPLGRLELKGFPEPMAAHVVLREREVESRFLAAREGRSLPPLEGRAAEVTALEAMWSAAVKGHDGAVLIAGDAGVGKSRLLFALEERIARGRNHSIVLSCQPQFRNTTLQTVIAFLQRRAGIVRDDGEEARFRKLAALLDTYTDGGGKAHALFAAMLKIPSAGLYEPPAESPQRQRQAFFGAVSQLMLAMAAGAPLLLCIEDLHWADLTTLEFVSGLIDDFAGQPVLLLMTTRPESGLALASDPRVETVALDGLSLEDVKGVVGWIAGSVRLPAGLVELIWKQSDGNPLFVEELTKTLLETGQLREVAGRLVLADSLTRITVPATLQDSLMARLDRLASAKELAQVGATIGREFSIELMTAVSAQPVDEILTGLAALENAEIIFERSGQSERTWFFKHALLQEAAYRSLLRSRRRDLHARIAEAIETRSPDELRLHPELMAHHLSRAGEFRRAVEFGMTAGMTALTRSANAEAIDHAHACLDWVKNLPEGEDRSRIELGVNAMLTPALMVARGYAADEVEAAANRALELVDALGDQPEMFSVIYCLKQFHHVRSERAQARALADRLLSLAARTGDLSQEAAGLGQLAQCFWIEGDHASAETVLRRAAKLYDTEQHSRYAYQYGFDFLTYSRMTLAQVLWITGRSGEGLREAEAAVEHARSINHANSVGIAMLFLMMIHQLRGERERVIELGRETQAFCEGMGVTTPMTYAAMIANWAIGDIEGSLGIFDMHAAIGAHLGMTYYRSLAAENAIDAGRFDDAEAILAPALEQAGNAGERYWEPQLFRLKARIARVRGGRDDATARLLVEAADKARAMGAPMLEALALLDLQELSPGRGDLGGRLSELLAGADIELPADAAARVAWLGLPAVADASRGTRSVAQTVSR